MPMPADDDRLILQQASHRARALIDCVAGDIDAMRAAASDAVYAEGVTRCEEVADATRQLMALLDADLRQQHQPPPNLSPSENPRP